LTRFINKAKNTCNWVGNLTIIVKVDVSEAIFV